MNNNSELVSNGDGKRVLEFLLLNLSHAWRDEHSLKSRLLLTLLPIILTFFTALFWASVFGGNNRRPYIYTMRMVLDFAVNGKFYQAKIIRKGNYCCEH